MVRIFKLKNLRQPPAEAINTRTHLRYLVTSTGFSEGACTVELTSVTSSEQLEVSFTDEQYKFYDATGVELLVPKFLRCIEHNMMHTKGSIYRVKKLVPASSNSIGIPWRLVVESNSIEEESSNLELLIPYDSLSYEFIQSEVTESVSPNTLIGGI
ncbi:hypothetical protein LIS04_166 [Listeria phage LIS04]|nr:hypothetical protein LIS04_166 [Listeria phage LIS04]